MPLYHWHFCIRYRTFLWYFVKVWKANQSFVWKVNVLPQTQAKHDCICSSLAELIPRCCRYLHPVTASGSHKGDLAHLQIYRKEVPECQDTVLMEEAGLNIYISFIIEKKPKNWKWRGRNCFVRAIWRFYSAAPHSLEKTDTTFLSLHHSDIRLGYIRRLGRSRLSTQRWLENKRENMNLSFGTQNNFWTTKCTDIAGIFFFSCPEHWARADNDNLVPRLRLFMEL